MATARLAGLCVVCPRIINIGEKSCAVVLLIFSLHPPPFPFPFDLYPSISCYHTTSNVTREGQTGDHNDTAVAILRARDPQTGEGSALGPFMIPYQTARTGHLVTQEFRTRGKTTTKKIRQGARPLVKGQNETNTIKLVQYLGDTLRLPRGTTILWDNLAAQAADSVKDECKKHGFNVVFLEVGAAKYTNPCDNAFNATWKHSWYALRNKKLRTLHSISQDMKLELIKEAYHQVPPSAIAHYFKRCGIQFAQDERVPLSKRVEKVMTSVVADLKPIQEAALTAYHEWRLEHEPVELRRATRSSRTSRPDADAKPSALGGPISGKYWSSFGQRGVVGQASGGLQTLITSDTRTRLTRKRLHQGLGSSQTEFVPGTRAQKRRKFSKS